MRQRLARLAHTAADRLGPRASPPEPAIPPEPPVPAPTLAETAFPAGVHERAEAVFARLRDHPHLSDRESRLYELVEYFGWEIGHRGRYAAHWRYQDDPREHRYVEALGVGGTAHRILHQYSLFNRLDPERPDFFWLYDGVLRRLEALGGPQSVSVLDFGTGLGQIGLALCSAGYRTVMSDREQVYLDFAGWRAANHGLEPVVHHAGDDHVYYDTGSDGHDYGLVVEWSAFEHVFDTIPALGRVTAGLVPGGVFVTTTFMQDWTPALRDHYRRDTDDAAITEQYLSPQVTAWLYERFEVLTPDRTLARVLVRR